MKKARPRAYQDYVRALCDKLRTEFFCGEYRMDIQYFDEITNEGKAVATIRTDTKYLNFTINVSDGVLRLWREREYSRIAEILLHEFAHLLTDPLYDIAIDAITNTNKQFLEDVRERQTQRITNVIFWRLPKSIYNPETWQKSKRKGKRSS